MNLEEILNYKTNCPICNQKLEIASPYQKATLNWDSNGLLLTFIPFPRRNKKEKILRLALDGSFEKKYVALNKLGPCIFYKLCPDCNRNKGTPKGYRASTLIESLSNSYFYNFRFTFDKANKTYTVSKHEEVISMIQEEYLYRIESSLHEKESSVFSGKTIDSLLNIRTPYISLREVKSSQDLINKIKLLGTFS